MSLLACAPGYEAKLGADLKKAARSTSGHHNDEEKGSDESEDVPELQEDVSGRRHRSIGPACPPFYPLARSLC